MNRRPFVLVLAVVTAGTISAQSKTEIAGTYEISTGEGQRGFLYVREDLSVRRRLTFADKTIHTQTGRGELVGNELHVRFSGTGDPHDLTGDWSVSGENEGGRYKGTAHFSGLEGSWAATFLAHYTDDGESLPEVEITGTLTGTTLATERSSERIDYTLSADGLVLTAKIGVGTETFKRTALPADGGPTAVYTFAEGGKVSGKLSSGAADTGTRYVTKAAETPSPRDLLALPIEPDPVPNSFKAAHEAKILLAPDGPDMKTVKAGEIVPVCGKQEGWWVVGPFKEGKKRWKGFLKDADLVPRLHYASVEAPVFTPGKRPSPDSVVQKDLGTCYFDAALMAISEHQPRAIESMIRDLKDGTVCVRFHERDEHGRLAPKWVRVKKTIIVDEKGRSHYTTGEGGQLWPALVEKAFAAWRGKGYYRNVEGGHATEVFETVLGRPAKLKGWTLPLPGELTDARMRVDIPRLAKLDREALLAFARSSAWKKEADALTFHPSWRRDIAYVDSLLGRMDSISEAGKKTLHGYYDARCEGPLGSGRYSTQAKDVHAQLKASLDAQRPVCLGTKTWGKRGAGQSGGENVELVAGLASSHEYMVLSASIDENRVAWVRVVNPWHHFSRHYERKGEALVATAKDGKNDPSHGTFDVELSDVMRYFASMAYVSD